LGLRRLADQLEAAGIQVLDDGSQVQLAPERRFSRRRLSAGQGRAAAPADPGAGRGPSHRHQRRHGHPAAHRGGQGATQLSIGSDGPAGVPRDSSETLAVLLFQGLLGADRDGGEGEARSIGRPIFGWTVLNPPSLASVAREPNTEEMLARPVAGHDLRAGSLEELPRL
jgi:hypothetical protein